MSYGTALDVLFVCAGNYGRSQIAEENFRLGSRHNAYSAGTHAPENALLVERVPRIVSRFSRPGHDISEKRTRRLTRQMADDADIVIVLMGLQEAGEKLPVYFKEEPYRSKTRLWEIRDPRYEDHGYRRGMFKEIERRVDELVDEIG